MAEWLAQQIVEAFPSDTAPTYLVRDNDGAYGRAFTRRVRAMGIRDRLILPRSPWQNPYAERLIGTVRRDYLDHVLLVGLRHLRGVLTLYARYYNETRIAFGVGQGRAATMNCPTIGDHPHHTNLVRIASSLRADMILGKDSWCVCPKIIWGTHHQSNFQPAGLLFPLKGIARNWIANYAF